MIESISKIIKQKQKALNRLKYVGKKQANKLDDLKLKVFILSFIEGKSNLDIAEELNYEPKTIRNIKCKLNNIVDVQQN